MFSLPTDLSTFLTTQTHMILWFKTYKHVSASTVSLSYRTCRHISVSTVKRHQPTSRYNGIDSKLENTICTHTRNRSFWAVRGTVKVTVPYRNFFHPQTSNQTCFPEKCLESHFWSVLETAQQMKNWRFQLPNLLSSLYVEVISMRHPRCPSYVTQTEYSSE